MAKIFSLFCPPPGHQNMFWAAKPYWYLVNFPEVVKSQLVAAHKETILVSNELPLSPVNKISLALKKGKFTMHSSISCCKQFTHWKYASSDSFAFTRYSFTLSLFPQFQPNFQPMLPTLFSVNHCGTMRIYIE